MRLLFPRMIDTEGNAATKILGIVAGRAAWVTPAAAAQIYPVTTLVNGVPSIVFDSDGHIVYDDKV